VLPFTGLDHPLNVAVDSSGSLYVVDSYNHRVLKLAAGSNTPAVLPFTGLSNPRGVAVGATWRAGVRSTNRATLMCCWNRRTGDRRPRGRDLVRSPTRPQTHDRQ
jgi:hypothetical protein